MADNVPEVGKLIKGEAYRDAIHVAVCPALATECLQPASPVRLIVRGTDVRAVKAPCGDMHGIVDPYLPEAVYTGEKFYVFLKPNTITSLRHVWTHPALKPSYAKEEKDGE